MVHAETIGTSVSLAFAVLASRRIQNTAPKCRLEPINTITSLVRCENVEVSHTLATVCCTILKQPSGMTDSHALKLEGGFSRACRCFVVHAQNHSLNLNTIMNCLEGRSIQRRIVSSWAAMLPHCGFHVIAHHLLLLRCVEQRLSWSYLPDAYMKDDPLRCCRCTGNITPYFGGIYLPHAPARAAYRH
jgi:hypothetical protein